jgi:hypothetical protein
LQVARGKYIVKLKYRFSFTAGSLLLNDSVKITEIYLETRDWRKTQDRVVLENPLQRNALSSQRRVYQEVKNRLKTLSDQEITYLGEAPFEDQKQVVFIAVCRYYHFIRDFVLNILREDYLSLKTVLRDIDYSRFTDDIALKHPEYNKLSDKTKKKLQQVLYKILVEMGLLSSAKEGNISPLVVSTELQKLLVSNNPSELALFLYTDQQIKEVTKRYG